MITTEPPRLVLDTNVLHAGLYSRRGQSYRVLEAVEAGRVQIILSTPMLFEYEDVLKRQHELLGLDFATIDALLDALCNRAECRQVYFLWRPCLPDPKDDMVLELAVTARACCILTHNVRDFLPAARFGIPVRTPGQLMETL